MTSWQHSVLTNSPQWLELKVGLKRHNPQICWHPVSITKLTLNEPAISVLLSGRKRLIQKVAQWINSLFILQIKPPLKVNIRFISFHIDLINVLLHLGDSLCSRLHQRLKRGEKTEKNKTGFFPSRYRNIKSQENKLQREEKSEPQYGDWKLNRNGKTNENISQEQRTTKKVVRKEMVAWFFC